MAGQEVSKSKGRVWKNEDEILRSGVSKCLQERDYVRGVRVPERGEDLGFPVRIVGLDVVRLDDDFEGAGFGAVDCGCHSAGNVVAVLVTANGDPG